MRVEVVDGVILIKGHCRVEEAEVLVGLLRGRTRIVVDLSACESLHAAVVQVLLAFDCTVVGEPTDDFLRDLLAPALARGGKVAL